MKILKGLDKGVSGVLGAICGLSQIAIVAIVAIQVFCRNVLFFDIGNLANFPVPLMILGMWTGSILVARERKHITVPLAAQIIKNKKVIAWINIVLNAMVVLALAYFSYKAFYYCLVTLYGRGTFDPAIGFPMWTTRLLIPISTSLTAVYYLVYLIKDIAEVTKR